MQQNTQASVDNRLLETIDKKQYAHIHQMRSKMREMLETDGLDNAGFGRNVAAAGGYFEGMFYRGARVRGVAQYANERDKFRGEFNFELDLTPS